MAQEDNTAEQRAQRLIALRGQVEQLSQELEVIGDEHRAEMGSLAAQKAELEASRNRLETNIEQLRRQLEQNRSSATAAGVDDAALRPTLFAAIKDVRSRVEASMPFKIEERLAELDEIKNQVETGVMPTHRAVNRLWGFYEDEIRLTRENGIYSQTISVNRERTLAEVAKLGSMMLFFRTQDERYGQAERTSQGWRFSLLEDSDAIAAVDKLFDSLRKQIRQGYFELPVSFEQARS